MVLYLVDEFCLDKELLNDRNSIIVTKNIFTKMSNYLSFRGIEYAVETLNTELEASKDEDICPFSEFEYENNIVVYIGSNKEEETLSRYYSCKMKKKYIQVKTIEAWQLFYSSLNNVGSIVFIFNKMFRQDMQAYLAFENIKSTFGILIFESLDDLLYIANKEIVFSGTLTDSDINVLAVNRIDYNNMDIIEKDNYAYIPRKAATAEIFLEQSKNKNVLTLIGHGRDELIWLTEALICNPGKSEGNQERNNKTSCEICGKCFKDSSEVISISELQFDHFFINTCCSGKITEAVFGNEHNVSYQFMKENAVSYIATPFLAASCPVLNNYYCALLQCGYSLGEIQFKINKLYQNYGYGSGNSYFLFGDPDIRHTAGENDEMDIKISFPQDVVSFEIPEKKEMVNLYIGGYKMADILSYRVGFVIKCSKRNKIFGVVEDCDNGLIIRIFSRGTLEAGAYQIERIQLPDFDIYSLRHFDYLLGMKLNTTNLKNYYYESMNSIRDYLEEEHENRFELDSIYRKNFERRKKIYSRIVKLSKDYTEFFGNKIQNKGFAFDAQCLESGFAFQDKQLSGKHCPYCDGLTYKSVIYNRTYLIERQNVLCTKCGIIFDAPKTTGLDMRFIGSSMYSVLHANKKVLVEIKNDDDRETFGNLSISVANGLNIITFSPQTVSVNISPHSGIVYEFEMITSDEIVMHNYWLMASAILNGEAYFIKKDIFLLTDV